jgi:ribonuclease-3
MADEPAQAPLERQGEQQPPPALQPRAEGAGPRRPLAGLQESLGYQFRNEDLLRNGLTHKSYLHAVPDAPLGSNERLEFLGDSVLGFIVSTDLFGANPDTAEGQLTTWRGALVRLTTLAKVAEQIELGEYMYMSRGEESAGGRARGTNLGRAAEALLGAVYLDGGMDAARDVWHTMLGESELEHIEQTLRGDYKTQLQQYTQAIIHVTPSYRLVDTSGPDHAKLFQVAVYAGDRELARGLGSNKQSAEQAAADAALQLLRAEAGTPDEQA